MTVTGSPSSDEAVLVGSTRAEAAAVFGTLCEHAFLTSYDDFDEEVDASRVPAVGLVAGEALEEVLTRIMVLPNGSSGQRPAVVVGLSADRHQLGSVERVLAAHPSIGVTEVDADDHRVLLHVAPADQVSATSATAAADALAALRRDLPSGDPGARGRLPGEAPSRERAPHRRDGEHEQREPARSRRARLGRLAGAALVAAVAVAVVGAAVGGLLGTTALLVLVLVVATVGLAAVVAVQWRLLTELRDVRREQAELGGRTDERTARVLELVREVERAQEQQAASAKTVAESAAATGERVLALGRLLARQGVASAPSPPVAAPPSEPLA
jgi:hypothetical protein